MKKKKNSRSLNSAALWCALYAALALALSSLIYRGPVRQLLAGEVEVRKGWERNAGRHFPALALCPVPGFRSGFTPNGSWAGGSRDVYRFGELGISAWLLNSSFAMEAVEDEEWTEVPSDTVRK